MPHQTASSFLFIPMELPKETLLEMYWRMLLARRLDERAWELHRQRKVAYHVSAIGHEAAQVGMAYAIERGLDWVAPYYRDLALMLALGLTPVEFMLGLFARRDDPVSGGRQMPALWSLKRVNVVGGSPVAAGQIPHAVGIGLAIKLRGDERIVLTTCGEGATSMGEWYEAVNFAAVQRLPVVFVVENNRYAISTRPEGQMAVPTVAERAGGLGLPGVTVDGTDLLAVHEQVRVAAARARAGQGPSLVELSVYRVTPHSSDDDDRSYRTLEEVQGHRRRDPLSVARQALESRGVLAAATNTRMEVKARELVEEAARKAEAAPRPGPEAGIGPVYATALETEPDGG